jgi:hypothetical protein
VAEREPGAKNRGEGESGEPWPKVVVVDPRALGKQVE